MPQVNCATGQGGENLQINQDFNWINWNPTPCTVSDCGDWCNVDTYTVPAASGGVPGNKSAHTRWDVTPGTYDFTSSCTAVPGTPHVVIKG